MNVVIQFSDLNPGSTGIGGTDGGSQFGNALAGDPAANTHTGLPGTAPHPDRAGDPGHGDAAATDPYGIKNGSDAPPVHGTTATSWTTLTNPFMAEANPVATGIGQGSVTNGSQRIGHGA